MASATVFGQLIVIFASPILTRLYNPAQFGIFAVFVALLGLSSIGSSLRFELAIPLQRYNLSAVHLVALALLINFAFTIFALLAIVVLRHPIATWTKTPALAGYLWLLPIGLFFVGAYRILNYWAIRRQNYSRVAFTKLAQSLSNISIQIAGGVAQFGVLGMIIGHIFGQVSGVISLASFAKKTLPPNAHFSLRRMGLVARRQRRFARYDTPAAIIDTASEQLPVLLFAVLFSPAIAGFYLLAQSSLSMPVIILGQAMGQVLYGRCRQAIEELRLGKVVRKMVYSLLGLVFIPSIFVIVWGEELFGFVFGEIWRQSGQFARWMMISIAAQFAYSPVSLVLLATKGQHINLMIHSTLLIARLAGILWGWMQADVMFAVAAFSISGMLGYVFGTLLILRRADVWSRQGASQSS